MSSVQLFLISAIELYKFICIKNSQKSYRCLPDNHLKGICLQELKGICQQEAWHNSLESDKETK
jgi:hypothetical protein